MCNWKKWIWPGIIATALLALAAVFFKAGPVEEELTGRASQALSAQHGWASVNLSGRDLTLKGVAPSETAKAEALALADGAYDVRVVADGTELLAVATPYPFGAEKSGNIITLTGNVPDEAARSALVSSAQSSNPNAEIVDKMTLARGASAAFPALAAFGAAKLADLSSGSVTMSDDDFSIKGIAATSASFIGINNALSTDLPDGGTLASADITPPAIEGDYTFIASLIDPATVSLDGFVPSIAVRDALGAKAQADFPDATITNNLSLAAGAPDAFAESAEFAIDQLPNFDSGSASISNKDLTVSGVASSSDSFTAARAALAGALPAGLTLASSAIVPPSADGDYALAAAKTDGKLRLTGFAPSTDMRDAIGAAASSNNPGLEIINDIKIAAGVPDGMAWDEAAGFGLAQMPNLRNGAMTLNNNEMNITGEAVDGPNYEALLALGGAALPAGIGGLTMDATLPATEPYTWSAAKTADDVTLAGFAPSRDVANATAAMVASKMPNANIIDQQQLATGEPADYDVAVAMSLDALSGLSSGSAMLSDNTLSITGSAPSLAARNVVEANAIDTGALTVTRSIESPTISPYTWSATKGEESVFLSGYVPSEAVKAANVETAKTLTPNGAVIDQQVLAEGAPEGFDASIAHGFKGLAMLDTGKVDLSGNNLLLTGAAKDLVTKNATLAALGESPASINTALEITSPVIAPYTWSAAKGEGSVFLSGYVPNEKVKAANVEAAKALTSSGAVIDQQVLAEGVPVGYGSAINYGFGALKELETGKASYQTGALNIVGAAGDYVTKLGLDERLVSGAPAFTTVTAAITSPEPPAPELPALPAPPPPPEMPKAPEPEVAKAPELPVVSPYTWSITNDDAGVTVNGYVPSEGGMDIAEDAATQVAEGRPITMNVEIAAGAPPGFGSAMVYGSQAVGELERGSASYSDQVLTITGEASSILVKERLEKDLPANAPSFTTVTTAITAPEPIVVIEDPCVALLRNASGPRYLNFDTDSAKIKGSTAEIDAIIFVVQRCPKSSIKIVGHTDSVGSDVYNEDLSMRRAIAIQDYMVEKGALTLNRFTSFGMGEAAPIATNDTAEGRAQNRRIEFSVSQ